MTSEEVAALTWMVTIIAWIAVGGCIGWAIGRWNGRPRSSIAAVLLLGPLGIIIALLLPRTAECEAARRLDIADRLEDLRRQRAAERAVEPARRQPGAPTPEPTMPPPIAPAGFVGPSGGRPAQTSQQAQRSRR